MLGGTLSKVYDCLTIVLYTPNFSFEVRNEIPMNLSRLVGEVVGSGRKSPEIKSGNLLVTESTSLHFSGLLFLHEQLWGCGRQTAVKAGVSDPTPIPPVPPRAERRAPGHEVRGEKECFLEKSFVIVGFNYAMVECKVVDRLVNI